VSRSELHDISEAPVSAGASPYASPGCHAREPDGAADRRSQSLAGVALGYRRLFAPRSRLPITDHGGQFLGLDTLETARLWW
jgi:hypothetical protein